MTHREVLIEEKVTAGLAAYLDDSEGLAALLDAIEALADDPHPPGAVPAGRTVWRMWIGRYRLMYAITDTEIHIGYIGRI